MTIEYTVGVRRIDARQLQRLRASYIFGIWYRRRLPGGICRRYKAGRAGYSEAELIACARA